jgi:hypothetical protein
MGRRQERETRLKRNRCATLPSTGWQHRPGHDAANRMIINPKKRHGQESDAAQRLRPDPTPTPCTPVRPAHRHRAAKLSAAAEHLETARTDALAFTGSDGLRQWMHLD